MEFILIFDWIDEADGSLYETYTKSYGTKEELFEAKKYWEKEFSWQTGIGRLILSPAIGYSWADLERLFQFSLLDAESKKAPRPRWSQRGRIGLFPARIKNFNRKCELNMKIENPEILIDNSK